MELELPAQRGWPFQLLTRIRYALTDDGLVVDAATVNVGKRTAPYGIGFHPWLSTGGAELDDGTVRLDAQTHVVVDERQLPTGTEPVAGQYDLREPRSAADLDLDDAWIDPLHDSDGRSWCLLTAPDGRTAAVWMNEAFPAWQVCSGNHIGGYVRRGLAAEPQTCVADAFNTGDNLIWLAPGEAHAVRWGATLI
jgi:aldose 1-epimerase